MLPDPSNHIAISAQPSLAVACGRYWAGYWRWFSHDAPGGQVSTINAR